MTGTRLIACSALLTAGMIVAGGCSSNRSELDFSLDENSGVRITTAPGEPIQPEWLYGKWDLDGNRTNTVNGNTGAASLPSNVWKDMTGAGWKFEPDNVLKIDKPFGYARGRWELRQGNRLLIGRPGDVDMIPYEAHFEDGFLYLKGEGGRWMVLERNKYFGF